MVGRNGVDFVHPPALEATRDEMRVGRRGRKIRRFDCRYVHKNGTPVPMAWSGVWSESEGQHFFIGRDMTEREASQARLRRAQRIGAVGPRTSGIAHDINKLHGGTVDRLDPRARTIAQ